MLGDGPVKGLHASTIPHLDSSAIHGGEIVIVKRACIGGIDAL